MNQTDKIAEAIKKQSEEFNTVEWIRAIQQIAEKIADILEEEWRTEWYYLRDEFIGKKIKEKRTKFLKTAGGKE